MEPQSDSGPYLPKNLLKSPLVLIHLLLEFHPQKSLSKSQLINWIAFGRGLVVVIGTGVVTKKIRQLKNL